MKPEFETYHFRIGEHDSERRGDEIVSKNGDFWNTTDRSLKWKSDLLRPLEKGIGNKSVDDYLELSKEKNFKNKAASGWAIHKIDEANRTLSLTGREYMRWKEAFGESNIDNAIYKPGKNWTVDQNNCYGYLYSRNKSEARDFAKLVNEENSLVEQTLERIHNKLQSAGASESARADAELETASSVLAGVKQIGERLWDSVRESSTELANAQAEQVQAQNEGLQKLKNQTLENMGQAAAAESKAHAESAKQVADVEKKAGQAVWNSYVGAMEADAVNLQKRDEAMSDLGHVWGITTGVTGSDQTGASIHGYRSDTRMKEPTEEWSDSQRNQYERLKKSDPDFAEVYAVNLNERYNQAAHDEKTQQIADWTSQSGMHGIAAWLGARGANLLSSLDGYNEHLERAAVGRNTVSGDISFRDLRDAVDDTNERNLSDRHGTIVGGAYTLGTNVTDALISRGAFGQKIGEIGGRDIKLNTVLKIADKINEAYSSYAESGTKNLSDYLNNTIHEKMTQAKKVIVGSEEWFAQQQSSINALTKKYMKTEGLSERTARWKATKELLNQSAK